MKASRVLLALGVSLALAAPTATSAAMMDMSMMHMDMSKMMEQAKANPMADKMMAEMAMMDTADRDFWLKCTFHKTAACEEAMAKLMAK